MSYKSVKAKVQSIVSATIKEAFIAGEIDLEQTKTMLFRMGICSREESFDLIDKWVSEISSNTYS